MLPRTKNISLKLILLKLQQVKPQIRNPAPQTPQRQVSKESQSRNGPLLDSRSSSNSSSPCKLSSSLESENKPRRKLPLVPSTMLGIEVSQVSTYCRCVLEYMIACSFDLGTVLALIFVTKIGGLKKTRKPEGSPIYHGLAYGPRVIK